MNTQATTTNSPKILVIYGFSESGKTGSSFEFAEQYRESFWSTFALQGDSHDLIVSSSENIVQFTDKIIEPNLAAAKHWLANQELPWLLITDNADDPELDMTECFPANLPVCILITTRNRDLRQHGNVGRWSFNLERLKSDEAKTVLLGAGDGPSTPSVLMDPAASQISEELQCLPSVLVSAGKTIRSKLCTWKPYLTWYQQYCDSVSRQLEHGGGPVHSDKTRLTIIPTTEPHFARLESLKDRVSTDDIELMYTLA